MTRDEMKAALIESAAEAGYFINDETAELFLRAGLTELHEQPCLDVDCSCELCRYFTVAP